VCEYGEGDVPEQVFWQRRTNIHNALRLALQDSSLGKCNLDLVSYFTIDIQWATLTGNANYYALLLFTISKFEELFQKLDCQCPSIRDDFRIRHNMSKNCCLCRLF
jgi:hypothetical protein